MTTTSKARTATLERNFDADPVTVSDRRMTARDVSHDKANDKVDDTLYTFKEIGELLNEKPNTISARWYPNKIAPVYADRDCPPLRVQIGETAEGNPKYKITAFGFAAIKQYQQQVITGGLDYSLYCKGISAAYPERVEAVVEAEIMPDVGSSTLVPTQSSALTILRSRLAVSVDDSESNQARLIQLIQSEGAIDSEWSEMLDRAAYQSGLDEETRRQELKRAGIAHAREAARQQELEAIQPPKSTRKKPV